MKLLGIVGHSFFYISHRIIVARVSTPLAESSTLAQSAREIVSQPREKEKRAREMLTICAAAYSFVAPQPLRAPTVQRGIGPTVRPQMGFFDDLKKGFENDEKLENKVDKTASGKTKDAADYVKKKDAARQAKPRAGQKQADEPVDDKMGEFLGKFKW